MLKLILIGQHHMDEKIKEAARLAGAAYSNARAA
jgi:hypothetical protein